MLTIQEIKSFIEADKSSELRKQAAKGQKYYEAEHDISEYRIFFFDANGKIKEDKTRSNIKISHAFFTELVDQCTQYMLSGDGSIIKSDDPELQAKLNEYFNENEDFIAELADVLTGTQAKGAEYMFAFKGKDEKTHFQCADSLGVTECPAELTSDKKEYVIYCYTEKADLKGKKVTKIQVWDDSQTYFFKQSDDSGKIELDNSENPNPRPHVLYKKDGDTENTYYRELGYIPFFRLDNNKKQLSALKPIKSLIDDYDLMNAGLSNNIQDTNEALYVVKGFQGDNLDELITNIRNKKHIGVDDEGGVDIKTVDIPVEARKAKMEVDEKNIYRFGMGFNSAQIGDGNITNIVIKSRYALLDLKCNKLEIKLKQFLRKLIKIVLDEINTADNTDYQQKDVYFDFKREIMTNASDNAQIELINAQKQQAEINTLLDLATYLDDETFMQNICDVLELDYESIKDKLPKDDGASTEQAKATLNAGI